MHMHADARACMRMHAHARASIKFTTQRRRLRPESRLPAVPPLLFHGTLRKGQGHPGRFDQKVPAPPPNPLRIR